MTQTPSFRDVEKLSAYLDGQLKPSEKSRLESRLQSDPELASILKELRQSRSMLRQLPQRRAPRNFTLTPKMVGQKPPLPRSYPAFRFATVLATLLLFFTLATNFMAPRLTRTAAPLAAYGMGGGGGGAPETELEAATAAAAQPLLQSAPAEEPAVPVGTPTPLGTLLAAPSAQDNANAEPTLQASEKSGVQPVPTNDAFRQQIPEGQPEPTPSTAPPISAIVQIALAIIAVLSALIAFSLRYTAIRQWRAKTK